MLLDDSRAARGPRPRWRWLASSQVVHLVVAAAVVVAVFAWTPAVFSGDTDTARNYLNTIVSSLSTILALCISIILVAIQLTASNYTHRVLDFFMRLPYNVSLFFIYLVTIMHSFFLMTKIKDTVNEPLPAALRPEMSADLVLVMICFISLLGYMYAVVQLLKPERIIHLIVREYGRAFQRGDYRAALDNVEQICDIAKRAASFNDSLTGMRCMDVMLNIAAQLPTPRDREDGLLEIHRNLVEQWVEMVGVAAKEKETGLLNGGLDALYAQGQLYMEAEAWPAAELVIRAYRHLTFTHLFVEGQVFYVERVARRLYLLGLCAAGHGPRGRTFCVRTWEVIAAIGESLFSEPSAGAATLLSGFLLVDELEPTLEAIEEEDVRRRVMALYMMLWKAFASAASLRDVARWAAWWARLREVDGARRDGQALALVLARHLGREDVAATLRHVWKLDITREDLEDLARRYASQRFSLLDGWPWPEPTS
ncbi:DUF2254 family protein [Alicyclobacillus sp.]|uniref:DUF2254 family protein n=1 Tax=Alicyclobacillus sp. TaxID=61169 RepID=UPI0025C1E702|nr:DUF2254 family protein [Alicyclobacillus sp.]MCL6515409.1 DUF2254 domain-containing protein [Alicyclobacillus sp.]